MKRRIFFFLMLVGLFFQSKRAFADVTARYDLLLKPNCSIEEGIQRIKAQPNIISIEDQIPEINVITVRTSKNISWLMQEYGDIMEFVFTSSDRPLKSDIADSFDSGVLIDGTSDLWGRQWDMQKSSHLGKKFTHKSNGTATIGVIDSGISYDNPEIVKHIISAENFVPNSETGVVDSSNITDKTGHGTSVAGQITSDGLYTGLAPEMKIRMYRVLENEYAQSKWIIKAIIKAAKDDVDVINLSLGEYLINDISDSKNADTTLIAIYQRAVNYARKQGAIIVASVGNEGVDLNDQHAMRQQIVNANELPKNSSIFVEDIPGQLDNVVTVGSVDDTEEISDFSNYGTGIVDIYAMGGGRRRLHSKGYDTWMANQLFKNDFVLVPVLEGKFSYEYGTSFAAPKISAALGLIIEKYHLKDNPDVAIKILYDEAHNRFDTHGNVIRLLDITNFVE